MAKNKKAKRSNRRKNGNSRTVISILSSHLWESANILRGPVDAADFKTYIFPLLFFKRISDVFDEETQVGLTGDGRVAIGAPALIRVGFRARLPH